MKMKKRKNKLSNQEVNKMFEHMKDRMIIKYVF